MKHCSFLLKLRGRDKFLYQTGRYVASKCYEGDADWTLIQCKNRRNVVLDKKKISLINQWRKKNQDKCQAELVQRVCCCYGDRCRCF